MSPISLQSTVCVGNIMPRDRPWLSRHAAGRFGLPGRVTRRGPHRARRSSIGSPCTLGRVTSTNWAVVKNGLDFLERSVTEMADGNDVDKYATIHLFSAIQVLIKARLMREHWMLACKKVDGVKQADFHTGLIETVGPAQELERLLDVVGLVTEKNHISDVKAVGRLRNRAIHFALLGEQPLAFKATLGRGLDFLLWFLGAHIKPGAEPDEALIIDAAIESIAGELGSIQAPVQQRMRSLAPLLLQAQAVVTCPRCQQPGMVLDVDATPARCLFCLWNPDGEEVAQEYVSVVLGRSSYVVTKDGGEWPVYCCTECGTEALVDGIHTVAPSGIGTPSADPGPSWACFECAYLASAGHFAWCTHCGSVMGNDPEGMLVCGDCFENIVGGPD